MRFEYAPGATPIDLDEAKGLIPAHLTLQRELNEYEETNILEAAEWLFARRRGDPLDERFIHVVHGRMFNQTWKWAGKSRRTDKNIGVYWFEIPVRLRREYPDFCVLSHTLPKEREYGDQERDFGRAAEG